MIVQGLSVRFLLRGAEVRAVTDASFELRPGRLLALVGESGCGKSVLASALLGLLPGNAEVRGSATLDGLDVLSADEKTLATKVRGRMIGLVPQSAVTHLTPVRTARSQLAEAVRALKPDQDVDELAERVGLEPQALDRYPHELSGGMAQRVGIAMALAGDPQIILADEPTSGLDRPLVDRTMDLLAGLAEEGRAVLLITHDLAAARRSATDLAVMYASRLVELGPAAKVFDDPLHPYTAGLLNALPEGGFRPIPGHPPELTHLPDGCAFRPRCPVPDTCGDDPSLVAHGDRLVACRRPC
ncbi:ABC transporter ATP-binding protein [Allokutzneria sp. A3M-2-11 16]|uniref:ABC transporter ATP-binding protein n=1 Tax=Allokutzneria sp. A3M-2-11 16 TaxID=2962043 RepID=UPI0020B8525F|nr:oligopeptide/dipeptide ABC transporter ATP-binding protein [Allokutzneria sp. A3M-2-11 16]MCP3797707.1 ABC transporter ATP-binding protein [Allokutzneria sp. A3M-2-11 16]